MDISGEQTRQSAENDTTEKIVEAMLKDSSVDDCVVLNRETETAGRELVAYVVTSAPFSPELLQSHLQALLPAAWVPSAYVPLSKLPLTPTGRVDEQALASLEVIDSDLLQRWEERLQALPEVEQVAAAVQEYVENVPPLYLSDLLPDWKPQRVIAHEEPVAIPVDPVAVQVGSKALAISHGGPLWEEPSVPTTLSETLQRAALQTLGNSITYLQTDGSQRVQSYAALLSDAERILAGLRRLGLKPQDKVIFQLEQNPDIISAFWGCILGGFIPVIIGVSPTYGEANSALDKLVHVWKLLDKPLILTSEALRESVCCLSKWLLDNENFNVKTIEKLRNNNLDKSYHPSQPDDVAFFNLTSGSTGVPKCIMLTHRNILSRARGTIQLCQHSSKDIILHWLPFDHIASISDWHIRCVYLGCQTVYVSKEYVLGRPLNWFDLIDKYRITHTFAPNFAYSLINDALGQACETPQWDLSCVKSLLTAAEAVSASVVEDCQKNLCPYGLKETAMQPAFGMAEFGSGITYFQHTKDNHPKFHTVDRSSLGGAVINVSPEHPNSITFTSLGPVIPGVSIRIVAENILLPEDTVGRLQVKGLAVSPGYYKAPDLNSEVFLEDGWFDTGDLGFISKGNLVITGRAKETIIINGANYYNGEIEAVVEEVEGVDVSYTAACSVRDSNSNTEKLAIFFSSSVSDGDRLIKLIGKIQERVVRKVRVNPAYLIPVEREVIPKTAIGKIQRSQLIRSFEAGEFDTIIKRLDILSGNANTLPDWFYRKIWHPKEAMPLPTQPTTGQSLVFLDQLGLGALLCEELGKLNLPCVGVEAGSDFNKLGDNRYRIDPNNPDHYRQLLESLSENDIPIAQVLHLWTYDEYAGEISSPEALEQSQELGVYSLLFLIQALVRCQGSEHSVRLYVIASHTQRCAEPADKIACEKAPVLGLLKTIPQEMPWLDCRHIDVTLDRVEVNAAQILQELRTVQKDREVAYRNGQRLVARLEKADLRHEQKQQIPFKRGGMYLLSGGLGGIGVEIAKYLQKHYQARLLLVGRTELPDRNTWETYLEQEDGVSQRIKAYLSLEQVGGEIIYEAVDICDFAQLQQVVDRTKSRWQCELDGVIHLAGIAQEQMLVEETRDSLAATLRPKVLGTWMLHQLLKDKPNSVFISSSSVNGFFGGTSAGAYAAANSFLDSFSHYQRTASLQSYCFAWSMWDEVGMSRGYQMKELSRARGYHAITADQGLQSLLAGLHHNQAGLLVGLDGSNRHIRRYTQTQSYRVQTCTAYFTTKTDSLPLTQLEALWVQDRFRTHSTCRFLQLQEMPLQDTGEIDREQVATLERQVSNERVPPRNELERQVASIWQEVLGVQGVGIYDNFFELGGHSLLTTQVISRVRDSFSLELPMRRLFELPTVAALSEHIEAARRENQSQPVPPLRPVSRDGEIPLSFAQQRLWFLDQLEGGSSTYNIPVALKIIGPLNVHALEMAVQEIVRRHEALRTTFPMVNGSPVQAIAQAIALRLPVVELGLPATQQEAEVQRLASVEARQPFDLSHGPLLRAQIQRLAEQEHVFVLTMHHIGSDGWSTGVFMRELAALYEAFSTGKPSPLPELPIQYADFAYWQRHWLQGEVLEAQLDYWKQQLDGAPAVLELPTDRPRPAVQTFRGATQSFVLPKKLTKALKVLSQRQGVTLFMTLLAAFQTLLYRYSGQEDILVGTPIANRNSVEIEGLIGFFANTLVLRTDMKGNPSFRELLGRVREVALEAYAHQDLPFEKLVEELQPERNLSHSPLFQVMFQLLNDPVSTPKLAGLTVNSLEVNSGTAKFDLSVSMMDAEQGLIGALEYNTDLFDATTITRMLGHFQTMLEGIVANAEQPISVLPLLTEAESHQLLVEWNDTQADYPKDACIHHLFEAQVERTPDAVAVIFEDSHLTYRELNSRANQLAHHLQTLGVGPEVKVGICLTRSLEMVVGLLGILKAGGAYVPLDPAYPKERLAFMMSDSQVPVLLTTQNLVAGLTERRAHLVCLDTDWGLISAYSQENPVSGAQSASLAYVIYTSGSTGMPKGVLVSHTALLNLVSWHQRAFEVTASDRTTQLAGTAFDASVWELWPYLAAGARIYLVESEFLNSPVHLRDWLVSKEITISFVPTPLAEGLLSLEWPENLALRIILTGGDQLHQYPSASVPFKVVNNYGPTENTIVTTSGLVVSNGRDDMLPPIGRPIANTQIYILDRNLQPVPIGVPGELHIGGAGLARGYLNRPELTEEKFIPNPFSDEPGTRLYKTGDLARYNSDGNIEFLGRIDNQVQIRGFRIELGEIEAVLAQHPTVQQTVVTAREDIPSNKRLVAYVVGQVSPPDIPNPTTYELRRFLKQKLPDYMVPSAFVLLDTLPLTPNGKVDRRALPAPEQSRAYQSVTFMAPRTPIEQQIADIWAQVLKLEQVGIHDNFFELGGHSLLATQVISQLRQALLVELPMRSLFEAPTVADLGDRIETLRWAAQDLQAQESDDTMDNYEEGEL